MGCLPTWECSMDTGASIENNRNELFTIYFLPMIFTKEWYDRK